MTATPTLTDLPGYAAGTWAIDPSHSEVGFTVRHLMVSKVRGRFTAFEGEIVTGDDPLSSSVTANVDLASIDTSDAGRDEHLRSSDFFDVATHPRMSYRSTGIRPAGKGYVVEGELSLHGVTRPVHLALEVNGFQPETPFGDSRVGLSATAEIDRRDFGIAFNMPLDGGGVVVGEKVSIHLEVEAVLQPAA